VADVRLQPLVPLPFEEAIEYWRSRVLLPPETFRELVDEARSRAFSVAGAARADIIQDVYDALQRVMEEGLPLAEFKREIAEIVEEQGWTGPQARRVDTIFRTNVQGAYNTGRWKQAQASAARRPYGMYSAVNDFRTRPEHAAMDGKVYPLDHPVWDTWWPPNGFNCRCTVRTLSEAEVDEFGLHVEDEDPTGRLFIPRDPDTGRLLPPRPLVPDEGWDHNPAKQAWTPDLSRYRPEVRARMERLLAEGTQR